MIKLVALYGYNEESRLVGVKSTVHKVMKYTLEFQWETIAEANRYSGIEASIRCKLRWYHGSYSSFDWIGGTLLFL